MTSQNDSVIICDAWSPTTPIRRAKRGTNFRKRVRNYDELKRSLLGTVYESPLVHLRRNARQENAENDVTVMSSPPSKLPKVNARSARCKDSHDQSIVVINDTTGDTVVEVALSDVETTDIIELPKLRYRTRSSVSAEPLLSLGYSRQRKRLRNKLKTRNSTSGQSTGVNDENRDGQIMGNSSGAPSEAEDIEVLWVSDSNSDPTRHGGNPDMQQPFIINAEPSPENLSKNSLHGSKGIKRPGSNGIAQPNGPKRRRRDKSRNKRNWRNDGTSRSVLNEQAPQQNTKLREIVIDGANVAMGHKHGTGFSEKGLEIVINYFKERGHAVRAFLPQYMRKADRTLLEKLHTSGHLVFTPSRKIGGKSITPYDDRFILEYATKCGGIVVSSDQYRDLWLEKPQWRDTIEKRLLTPTFVGDYLMFPEDPLGRNGPKLEEFLRHQ